MLQVRRLSLILAVALFAFPAPRSLQAQDKPDTPPAPIAGKWDGTVKADLGEMRIIVTLAEKDGVVTGTIENMHGAFKIKNGALTKGVWVLPFETDDGRKGTMKGTVKGDEFAGEWDFKPAAFGSFSVARVK